MASIGTAYIEVKGDYSKVQKGAKKGLSPLKKLAGVAMAGGLAAYAKSAVDVTTTIAKGTAAIARTTGMNTKEASRWMNTARAFGVETKAMNMGFITLSRSMSQAAAGGDKQQAMFKQLGVSMSTIKAGDTSKAIMQLSDAFAKMPNGANKAALAQKLFGRQGQTMLMLLNKGSGALREQLGLSDKYGLSMDKNQVEKALKAAAAQRRLNMALEGIKVSVGSALLPAIADATDAVVGFFTRIRSGKGIAGKITDVVKAGFQRAKRIADAFSKQLGDNPVKLGPFELPDNRGMGQRLAEAFKSAIEEAKLGQTIAQAVSEGMKAAPKASQSIAPAILDTLGDLLDVSFWFKHIGEVLALALAATKFGIIAKIPVLGPALKSMGDFMVAVGGRFLKAAGGAIAGAFMSAVKAGFSKLSPTIGVLFFSVKNAIARNASKYAAEGGTLAQRLGRAFADGLMKLPGIAVRGITALARAIVGAAPSVLASGRTLGNRLISGIRDKFGALLASGSQAVGRVVRGIRDQFSSVVSAGSGIGRSAIRGLKSMGSSLLDAGGWVVRKIGNGISNAISELASSAGKIASTIINSVKTALGIRSPSRVFMDIGRNVVQGFANGINRGNVKGFLGRAFGGTGKFVKGLVKKGMASVGGLPTALAEKLGFFKGGTGGGRRGGTLALAQKIAQMAGLSVGSTFRTPAQNAAAGGVPNSSHLRGSRSNPGATDLNGPVPNLYAGSRIASRFGPIENLVHDAGSGLHLHLAWFARGGKVTRPSYVAGEEAPRYPEYIISTNPRDRSRSHSLWMQAARDIGISGFKKGGVAKETARRVKSYLGRDTLLDALIDANVKPSKALLEAIGRTPEGRRAKIDKLLKRKGLTRDDRLSLLQLRADTFQSSSSEGTTLAEAMAAQAEALKDNTEQMAQNKKFAEQMHQTVRSVTQETLNGLLDQSVGGHLAQFMLTNSPKAAW